MKPNLTELAHLIHDAQNLDEFWGALREWARTVVEPLPLGELRPSRPDEIAYIEMIRQCNYRQQWALQEAAKWGRITSSLLANRFRMSMESARLDLRDLVEQGRLLPISDRKGRYYIPVHPNTDSTPLIPQDMQGTPQGVPQPPLEAVSATPVQQISEY